MADQPLGDHVGSWVPHRVDRQQCISSVIPEAPGGAPFSGHDAVVCGVEPGDLKFHVVLIRPEPGLRLVGRLGAQNIRRNSLGPVISANLSTPRGALQNGVKIGCIASRAADVEILRDLRPRPPACQRQPHSLSPILRRRSFPLRHGTPPGSSVGALHFSRQVHCSDRRSPRSSPHRTAKAGRLLVDRHPPSADMCRARLGLSSFSASNRWPFGFPASAARIRAPNVSGAEHKAGRRSTPPSSPMQG